MKRKLRHSVSTVILSWVAIYALALFLGAAAACFYSYESTTNLPYLAAKDAEYYLETGEFTPKTSYYGNSAFVYDSSGQLIDFHREDKSSLDFQNYAEKNIPSIDREGISRTLILSRELSSRIGISVGVPMEGGGYYFLIRSLHSLTNLLTVLFSALTVFLVLSCIYSVLIDRNNRRVEEMRREYVANVSHELKSPIASIKALSESLYDGVISDSERQKKCIGLIRRETDRLESTVMNMLELSRTQSMQTGYEKSAIRPAELFLPIVEKFSERCSGLEIQFTPPADTERLPTLFTNADRVRVLTNVLLDNAIKFVSPGGHIRLEAEMGHKCIIVCVRDDGVGIPKDEQKRIFERFYTGNLARNSKGSGLGLAIADETARILGEKLWVESAPGKGAAFYFTIGTKTD